MPKIAIVGEAWGQQESIYRRPFVGAAGDALNRMLFEAGILEGEERLWFRERETNLLITNVFNMRPKDNDIEDFCCSKKELPPGYDLPCLKAGKFIRPEFAPELLRLKTELEEAKPNIIIALGNTACWALLRRTGIDQLRGAVTKCALVPGLKVIPAYHPAAILRMWNRRPITIMDLAKAKDESESAEINRTSREVWLNPTIPDLYDFEAKYIAQSNLLGFDIENPKDQADGLISCLSFAPDLAHAIVVPFFDPRKPMYCYWSTVDQEVAALRWTKSILESPIPKVGQNGLYDISHLARVGVKVRNYDHDTMLMHHSLQPEEKKGLGVLGSLYAGEDAWKTTLKERGKKKSVKRND